MKPKVKKVIIKTLKIGGIILTVGTLSVGSWVAFHQPTEGNHTWRSTHNIDGRPKKCFNTAARANLQSIIQLVKYKERCVPYREPSGYYTGHSH